MICVRGRHIAGFPGFALNGMSHEGFARMVAADPFCMHRRQQSGHATKTAPEGESGAVYIVPATVALRGDVKGGGNVVGVFTC